MATDWRAMPRADRVHRTRAAIRAAGPVRGLAERSPVHSLDRRRLNPWAVATQSLGSIAPAAAAATTPAVAIAASTGEGAIISALLALGIALLVAAAINVFTRRLTTPGSLYTFAVKGLGPFRGYLVGCALMLGYGGIAAACIAAAAHYLTRGLGGGTAVAVAFALAVVAIVVIVVRRGTRSLWPALLVVELLSVAAVLAASVVLILSTTGATPATPPPPSTAAPGSGLLLGVIVGVVISASGFVGFESGTALGPETRRPFLVVPRVVTWTPIVSGAVLIVSTCAQALAFRFTGLDPATSTSPLPDLLAAQGDGAAWALVLDVAIGASFIAGALASVTALARLLFALALERVLPAPLARVHPQHRTPYVALLWATPVIGGVPIVALALGMPIRGLMDALVAIGVLGYLLAYLGVSLAAPRFLARIGESTGMTRIGARVTAVALAALVSTYVVYLVAVGSILPVVVVGVAIAASAVYFRIAITRRPDIMGALGVYDATSAEDLRASHDNRSPAA